jgi:peptide/nickel transport system substrate-binding protein
VLRIGLNDDPDALDPTISRAYVGRLVFAALCDKLFDVTPDLKIVPQLAVSHEWAADHKSIVIKLRPGVKFHDGEPLNAEAVKFKSSGTSPWPARSARPRSARSRASTSSTT